MKTTSFILISLSILLPGCITAHLDDGGARIQVAVSQDPPNGYTLIGPIEISGFDAGRTYPDAIVRLRNKAATMGGDLLVIDNIQFTDTNITLIYIGYGRVYRKY